MTPKDVALFLYLVVGMVGTGTLVAMELGFADFLFHAFYLFLIAGLVFSHYAWIPAIVLIVVYHRSWLIVIPASTALASSIVYFVARYNASEMDSGELSAFPEAPLVWVAAFFPVSWICGLVWAVKR